VRFWPYNRTSDDYYELLKRLHLLLKPVTYVEIGIRRGESFELARAAAHAVGIDPNPALNNPLWPGARVFALTSDAFFASHDLGQELGGNPVDLAFIDGLHLFEFALRDFINLEKYARRSSTVLVHDCYPIDATTASRERTTQTWSGDVWKLIVCLKKYRPDLEFATVDVPPTGLGIIRNLDPGSTVLHSSLDRICQEFIPLDFEWIAGDKARHLNRLDNDWNRIRALFGVPPRTGLAGLFRSASSLARNEARAGESGRSHPATPKDSR
jgi:hypothetical protein